MDITAKRGRHRYKLKPKRVVALDDRGCEVELTLRPYPVDPRRTGWRIVGGGDCDGVVATTLDESREILAMHRLRVLQIEDARAAT